MRVIVLDRYSFSITEYINVTSITHSALNSQTTIVGVSAYDNTNVTANYPDGRYIIRIMENK